MAGATCGHESGSSLAALAGNLGVLGYFKYYDFFVTSTNNLFALGGVDLPLEARSILLPVGISFFTFMAISYVVDVYRGDFAPVRIGTLRRISRSSRTSSPARSCGPASSSRRCRRRAIRATSTHHGRSSSSARVSS
jgi:D-alanyl-lipoteichoic acid acyltransferase DltB (MBOAT superfamily)